MARVTWGIVGTASIARRRFVPGIKEAKNAELIGIAGRDIEKARRFAAESEVPKAYGGYDELLADPSIEAVYIPLPNHLHREWTIKAAEAGKHVLCEKPLAPDPADCRRMIDACRKADVLLMEGFMYRFHPRTVRMKELLDSGKIGRLKTIVAVNTHLKPLNSADARFSGQPGSGVLMDVGVYCVNIARYLFRTEPVSVVGKANFLDGGVDVSFSGMLDFPEGGVALFDSSYETSYRQYLEVGGVDGAMYSDRPFVPGNGSKTLDFTRQGSLDVEKVRVRGADQFRKEIEAFSGSVLRRSPAPLDPEDSIKTMRVVRALMKSALSGKNVSL